MKKLSVWSTAVLAASIAVEDNVSLDRTRRKSLLEGGNNEVRPQMISQSPSDDLSRVKIYDHGQVSPTGGGWNEGNITSPNLILFLR